ncbi:hypothetical protein [Quadrisphaera sp. INWT6]|uniref:hypothetical protein n=1 Tax=Quadrisphaera sp. INWT6 TaxID=2596917 RepID=UPI00189219F8|nr:hypothetical protein [Quadrisphaera sp. INWT6]MBF5081173.1 hypothetical protein [Quadrisphaera sp. INWT6]
MPSWVIRKTLPTHDFGFGQGQAHGAAVTSPHFLYWAGTHNAYPRAPSWVWLSGLCPQVAYFRTRADAEAAAYDFAGDWKRALSIRAVAVDAPSPRH